MASNKLIRINVPELIEIIRGNKRNLIYCFLLVAVVSVTVAFSIPRTYKASVMLAPESTSSNGLSNFSSLADMVGINFDMTSGNDAIYPEIYPDLIKSNNFIVSLFDIKVKSLDGTINTTYYDYMKNRQVKAWWNYPIIWIKSLISSSQSGSNKVSNNKKPDPFMLSKEQYGIVKDILGNINCSVDKKTSVITIQVTAQDPLIAADMTEVVRKQLQEFITIYRTNKARTDMEYVRQLQEDAFKSYETARNRYARFSDGNQNITLSSYKIKKEEYANEMMLRFSTYKQLTEQYQMTKAKVLERTPAFTIVQLATVPIKHSNLPKIVILFFFEVFGLGLYTIYLCYKNRRKLFVFFW